MGNSQSHSQSDPVHALSQVQRRVYLINGYIHIVQGLDQVMPKDITSIINSYLEEMVDIRSKTDIDAMVENEKIRRQQMVKCMICHVHFLHLFEIAPQYNN